MPISNKEGTAYGGPGVLWHIKIRYLPNAVSQSLRIQLALNSLIRTPVSNKEGTAYGAPGVPPGRCKEGVRV